MHVSELPDPGRYLDGGELLLTTGIALTGRRRDADYVGRLAAQGVGGRLGLGLGEGWDGPPPGFVHACATNGVPLFLVPMAYRSSACRGRTGRSPGAISATR